MNAQEGTPIPTRNRYVPYDKVNRHVKVSWLKKLETCLLSFNQI